MDEKNVPVVMIGYSRTKTLEKSLRALSECFDVDKRDIFLFLDAPYKIEHEKAVDDMYFLASKLKNDVLPQLNIIRRKHNFGVPGNLISAVNEIINKYGRVIFFEDDVLVSRTFLQYMDNALEFYGNDKRIWCINANSGPYVKVPGYYYHDVYLSPRNLPWGWGTWADRWNSVDFKIMDWPLSRKDKDFVKRIVEAGEELLPLLDGVYNGKVRTWDVQCTYHMVKNNLFSIEPKYRLSKTIGLSTAGAVNCRGGNSAIECQKFYNFNPKLVEGLVPEERIMKSFCHAWAENKRIWQRIIRKIHRIVLPIGGYHNSPINLD